jgi:cephalosporin hydroxylase
MATFKKLLFDEIKQSRSDLITGTIAKEIEGKTFHHHYHLLYDLRTILGSDKKKYTEIGVFYGGSLALMMHHPYETDLTSIDLFFFEGQRETLQKNIDKYNKYNQNIAIYKTNSHSEEFIEKLKEEGFNTDILFIDGDHSKEGTILDFKLFEQFVNCGGFIVFDDYQDRFYSPEVKVAVDEIVENIQKGEITGYEIIGSPENFLEVDPAYLSNYNEFILRKL